LRQYSNKLQLQILNKHYIILLIKCILLNISRQMGQHKHWFLKYIKHKFLNIISIQLNKLRRQWLMNKWQLQFHRLNKFLMISDIQLNRWLRLGYWWQKYRLRQLNK
jgi:hypothetical protein